MNGGTATSIRNPTLDVFLLLGSKQDLTLRLILGYFRIRGCYCTDQDLMIQFPNGNSVKY